MKFDPLKHEVLIGIDTGDNTGVCVYDRKTKKIWVLETVPIHKAMDFVRAHCTGHHCYKCFVRVEDARLRKKIPYQANLKAEMGRREGAGSIKRDANIWEDFLTDHKIDFELVAPKDNKTKLKAEYFNALTGWTNRTTEHARDAAMLVYGF